MSDTSDQRRYYERMIDEIAAEHQKQLDQLKAENAEMRRLARDLYALLTAPEPYTPAEMAARIAARDYVKVRMSELGLEVDE